MANSSFGVEVKTSPKIMSEELVKKWSRNIAARDNALNILNPLFLKNSLSLGLKGLMLM